MVEGSIKLLKMFFQYKILYIHSNFADIYHNIEKEIECFQFEEAVKLAEIEKQIAFCQYKKIKHILNSFNELDLKWKTKQAWYWSLSIIKSRNLKKFM